MDRAGLVGADGPTHAGSFDLAYLGCLPNFVIMAASDEAELRHMVATQVAIDDRPSALRYPRGEGTGIELPKEGLVLPIGKGRILARGHVGRHSFARRAPRRGSQGGGSARRLRSFRNGRRCALHEAARPRARSRPRPQSRSAGHGRGGGDRRLRQPCAPLSCRGWRCSIGASRFAAWCCRTCSSTTASRIRCTSSPA